MLTDVQNTRDFRNIDIHRVGVKKVHLPLQILEKGGRYQAVLGEISLGADLSHEYRGTHMSRFMETLNRWCRKNISSKELKLILEEIIGKLKANRAEISLEFKYFIEKTAPQSGLKGMLDYLCRFVGIMEDGRFRFILGVEVPINTVCPCSKEISEYGAHNQRAAARVRIEYSPDTFVWLEDLIGDIEKCGSFQIFPVIKRIDEKYITERAFENPKFVEDVVREIVTVLRKHENIIWFDAECEASESIHNHNAFAYVRGGREMVLTGKNSSE